MRTSPGRQWAVPRWQPKRYLGHFRNLRVHGGACPTGLPVNRVGDTPVHAAARTAAAYFEMFGGLIGAVASDCGEVVEA